MEKIKLNTKQRRELHLSLLGFFKDHNFNQTISKFQKEANLIDQDGTSKILERKWNSVLRLQRKILELENKVKKLEEDLSQTSLGKQRETKSDATPVSPSRFTLEGHQEAIVSIKYHPKLTLIGTVSEDGTIKIWDYEMGEYKRTLRGHKGVVQALDWSEDGSILVTSSADLSIKLWDTNGDWNCLKTLIGHEENVSSVVFLPKSLQIVSSSRDKTIKLWELSTGFCIKTFVGHDDWVRKVIVNFDGSVLASCSSDQTARIWNISTGKCLKVLKGHEHVIESLDFSPLEANEYISKIESNQNEKSEKVVKKEPSSYLVTGSRDKTIKLWDISTGQCIQTFIGHDNWVRQVLFHPCGKFIISCSDDRTIRIWEIETGRCIRILYEAHEHFIQTLSFNPRFPQLASGSVDCMLKIWDCR
ncbi:lissencephaly-1 [Anaeramoeba ignava]|uniref:Lissencephaly-1 homolog n=1 Tax=Anaeramoeba ignava TaxID=1746090 RepID=A0A9Q0L5R3_ANAIG|nr:lissencephaly-1 [Anaeramoeba ignava]|eukprot:Anaeramoba_ignava/a352907_32.p1 GENE.a352907_32~~a352907_32.p1  ORF type:complete len:433 (+),score=107.08 a352907_32:50-1300(+)